MGNPYDGIILIHKEEGNTSFDVVKRVRRILKVKKVGHAGTLDPFATGLLIILLGQGTKLSNYLMAGDKVYQATMRLGVETDTQDLTGRVVKRSFVPEMTLSSIKKVALRFLGEIEQVPPPPFLRSSTRVSGRMNWHGKESKWICRKGRCASIP